MQDLKIYIWSEVSDISGPVIVYEYIFFGYCLPDSFLICVQSKMDKSTCIGQCLSLSPIFLILGLLSATGSSQQLPRAATPCLPNNPKCYFERFANFKIPQVEPLKVSWNQIPCENLFYLNCSWTENRKQIVFIPYHREIVCFKWTWFNTWQWITRSRRHQHSSIICNRVSNWRQSLPR